MNETTETIWDVLEESAPDGCDAVQTLYSWSLNYDAGHGPFTLFVDLIGWSDENLGQPLYDLATMSLGYVELSYLAAALTEYADRPHDVSEYVDRLLDAETRD